MGSPLHLRRFTPSTSNVEVTAGSPPSITPTLAVVPPMSNVIKCSTLSPAPVARQASTPGGGPRLDDVDRVLPRQGGGGESPVGLHYAELAGEAEGGEGSLQLREEPADDRLHVGVGDDGARALVLAAAGGDV